MNTLDCTLKGVGFKSPSFFKRLLVYIRWIFYALILQFIFIPYSYVVYNISYPIRDFIRKTYESGGLFRILIIPLWIVLNDEADYGAPWWQKINNIDITKLNAWQKFKVAYRWSVIRNPAWNQYKLIYPKKGYKLIVYKKGHLIKNGEEVSLKYFAVLKYINKLGEYTDNQGDFLSKEHSIFGESEIWYYVKNRLYWRRSLAKQYGRYWIELHLGVNDIRYTIRFKIKKDLILK